MTARGADPAERVERADPRARAYLTERWSECWPTLVPFEHYPPERWSDAICRWAARELDRIDALLARVDAVAVEKVA